MSNCQCNPEPDYSLEQQVEVKQVLGLRYNEEQKTIEIGVKCGEKSIEMALKIEEAREFQAGLAMVLEEASLAQDGGELAELPLEEAPLQETQPE